MSYDHVPRVSFTSPELAQVGMTEEEARRRHRKIRVLRWPYAENDRARAERETEGFVKVIATPRGRILGAPNRRGRRPARSSSSGASR